VKLLNLQVEYYQLLYIKGLSRIASAEIVFTDADHVEEEFPWSNKDFTKPGTEVEIKAGYHDEIETVFKGIIVRQAFTDKQKEHRPDH
jgi:hypothetical protein